MQENILEEYVKIKREHSSFFKKYTPEERLQYSNEMISVKTQCDIIEGKLIDEIIKGSYEYHYVFNYLSGFSYHHFLKESPRIKEFLTKSSVRNWVGYDHTERIRITKGYKDLCEKVWEDYLITNEEREELDNYCIENKIDVITKKLIEGSVVKQINKDGLDISSIVKYYYEIEDKNSTEIKDLLLGEYKIAVPLEKINGYIIDINKIIIDSLNIDDRSKLIHKLQFGENCTIYVVTVDKPLGSSMEFDIGYLNNPNDSESFKILIPSDKVANESIENLINIISDAICYKNSIDNDLASFLELKVNVKATVKKMLSMTN